MNTPKLHADMIKAWADGYGIEAYNPERGQWISVPEPGWFNDIEYRVTPGEMEMPEPVWASYDVRVEPDLFDADCVDLHNYSERFNLRLEFRDGKLLSAKLLEDEDEGADEESPW